MIKSTVKELINKFRSGKVLSYEEADRIAYTRSGDHRGLLRIKKKTVNLIELAGQGDNPVIVTRSVIKILRLARMTTISWASKRNHSHEEISEFLKDHSLSLPEPWNRSTWSIDNGSIKVGCTTIPWKEVNQIGKQLKLWD